MGTRLGAENIHDCTKLVRMNIELQNVLQKYFGHILIKLRGSAILCENIIQKMMLFVEVLNS